MARSKRRGLGWFTGGSKPDAAAQPKTWDNILHIDFECAVGDGLGRYSRLVFPTREEYTGLPEGWSDTMQPGSLNANLTYFPEELSRMGPGTGIEVLDNGALKPVSVIPAHLIENNSLQPNEWNDQRGNAQIWPCEVTVERTSETFNAWAVRRNGSAYRDIIELMSDQYLRKAHDLQTGDAIKLRLFGQQP